MPEVRRARTRGELRAAFALREAVFGREQRVPVGDGSDRHDAAALQVVAVDVPDAVLGTCRVVVDPGGTGRLGWLCVAQSARRRGVGAALLACAEAEAHGAGVRRMGLHAQAAALPLYVNAGYAASGQRFYESGIEHVPMEKELP